MKKDDQLVINHLSSEVRQLIELYATVNNCTQGEMLERIIVEWHAQQSLSERPPGNEDE
jgi:hypothetical protein